MGYRALRLDTGNFAWGSEAHRTKTLVKSAIVQVDAVPFRQRYEAHYATPLGRKKNVKLTEAEEAVLSKKRSKKTQKKYDERKKGAKVENALEEQLSWTSSSCHLFPTWPVRTR